ncbi:MAG TPA: hypothetical protein VGH24_06440, partial [Solirubrobacteraceae bacterium]
MRAEHPVQSRFNLPSFWPSRRTALGRAVLVALFAIGAAAMLAACGGSQPTDEQASAALTGGPAGHALGARNVSPKGLPRPAPVIYRPAGLSRATAVHMVVGLHASGGTPMSFEQVSGLDAVAQQHGFVVAYLGSPEP